MNNKKYFDNLFKEIYRHVLTHNKFHGIYMEKVDADLSVIVDCHCGCEWSISFDRFRDSETDYAEILTNLIDEMNSPDFFVKLKEIKVVEKEIKENKEVLLKETEDPTISSLDF